MEVTRQPLRGRITPPACRGVGLIQEGADHPQEGVGLQEAIGIHAADQVVAGHVDAAVQGVGLASVLLVYHHQVAHVGAFVDRPDLLGGDELADDPLGGFHAEGSHQLGHGVVCGAVVDHHHLEFRIAQADQAGDAGHHACALVVGGADQGDGQGVGGLEEVVQGIGIGCAPGSSGWRRRPSGSGETGCHGGAGSRAGCPTGWR